MTQIIGIDISKASVSACLILENIDEPREFYYRYKFHKFAATVSGISKLLALIGTDRANTIAIMEPTGVNYQILWGTQLARAGIEVRLVGHRELRSFREHHLGLPIKTTTPTPSLLRFTVGITLTSPGDLCNRAIARSWKLGGSCSGWRT